MEVVYDLDTEAKETAARLGIPYERADTVSTDPGFVSSLVDVLEERAAQARGENPARVTVTGTGFAPKSTVTLTLHSEPVEVGTATTDASGDFTAEVTVPAATEAGDHTVVAESASPVVSATAPLTVTAPPAPAADPSAQPSAAPAPAPEQGGKGGLARTGTNALLAAAAALIAAGAGTAFIRRSRAAKA